MKKEIFQAAFTGQLSTLGRYRFRPPLRVEKGKRYELRIDEGNGRTQCTEILERGLSPSHPGVLPTAADGVGPLRPGPARRHPQEAGT